MCIRDSPLTIPASSASPELNAMVFCVTDQCLMVCAPRTHTSPTRRAPCEQTPCEVCVHADAEGNPFVLPREAVDATRA
eukprot:5455390-Alexandrium_andersonii.AAC.1